MAFVLLFISLTSVAAASAASPKPLMRQEQTASQPHRVAIDPHGSLVFAETVSQVVPTVSATSSASTETRAERQAKAKATRAKARAERQAAAKAERARLRAARIAERKLSAEQCHTSFFTKGSDCVDGDADECQKWKDDVPKVERAPYVAILQVRAMGKKTFSGVATELGESDMATGTWKPSSEDEAAYKAKQAAMDGDEAIEKAEGQMFKKDTCIDPSSSRPGKWAQKCCTCMQKILTECKDEVNAECFKEQLCKSISVCQTWKDSVQCEKSSLLFERGASATEKDAVASLDGAVQGKGGDTCN